MTMYGGFRFVLSTGTSEFASAGGGCGRHERSAAERGPARGVQSLPLAMTYHWFRMSGFLVYPKHSYHVRPSEFVHGTHQL